MKSTTSSRVKTAPRDFVADDAGNVNSTSKEKFAQVKSQSSQEVVCGVLDKASFFIESGR